MLLSGKVSKGELPAVSRTLSRSQAKGWFAARLVLSLVLLGFGVGAQTLSLRLAVEPAIRAMDEAG